ncbi:MAG: DUF3098 domain-containing protein [Bacteroidales bacterium]|nr:DUF3098 domain-containing protein [Bacteroidales bacterium]
MKQKETKKAAPVPEKPKSQEMSGFVFGKENYRLLIVGLLLIVLGFLLMIGGGSDDPNVFSDKIFNFQRLTLAPILIVAGYIVEIYAIMKKSSNKTDY